MRDEEAILRAYRRLTSTFLVPLMLIAGGSLLMLAGPRGFGETIPLLNNISIALIAAGIIVSLNNISLSQQMKVIREGQEEAKDAIHRSVQALSSIASSGIQRVYASQSKLLSEYPSIVSNARVGVDILSTTMVHVFWNEEFSHATRKALRRGVRFRVILLNPRSPDTESISQREGRKRESVEIELRRSMKEWFRLQNEPSEGELVEVRLCSTSPGSFLFITESTMFFAPYLHSVSITAAPCFQVSDHGEVFQTYKRYFDAVWAESQEVNLATQMSNEP